MRAALAPLLSGASWSRLSGMVPSLDIDFAHGRAAINGKPIGIASLLGWTNANATFVTTLGGTLISIPANTPRLSDQGALIEQGTTNLVLQSQTLQTTWTATRSTIGLAAWTAPDNTATGQKLTEDNTATNTHFVSQNITKAASALAYTFSVYAKSGAGRTRINLQLSDNAGNGAIAVFDLAGQQVGVAAAGVGTPFTALSSAVVAYANGVTRCSITATSNTATTLQPAIFLDNGSGTAAKSNSYTGDNASGAFVWGAQVEQLAFPTSYVATTTTSVARAADAATLTSPASKAFSLTYPWSVYSKIISNKVTTGATITAFQFDDGSDANRFGMRLDNLFSAGAFESIASTTNTAVTGNQSSAGTPVSVAAAFNTNDGAVSLGGGAVGTQATFPQASSITAYVLGGRSSATNALNGYLSRLAIFSGQRIGNSQLVVMSGQ